MLSVIEFEAQCNRLPSTQNAYIPTGREELRLAIWNAEAIAPAQPE